MKILSALVAVVFAASFLGCGGSEETATSSETSSGDRTATKGAPNQRESDYPLPNLPAKRPPLERLVVKDLEVGTGSVARWGDKVTFRYVGMFWKTGKLFSQHWGSTNTITLDGEEYGPGWQKGVRGMRVGGRREFWIPGALVFDGGTDAAYVVKLEKVERGATG